jgi:hypothetical protein
MKVSTLSAYVLGVIAAILTLAGCGSDAAQPQVVASQARSQASMPNFIRPAKLGSGKVKRFSYWWVWNEVKVPPGEKLTAIYAECPDLFLPTGGGYTSTSFEASNVIAENSPYDTGSHQGWVVDGYLNNYPKGSVVWEVWAICAPDNLTR